MLSAVSNFYFSGILVTEYVCNLIVLKTEFQVPVGGWYAVWRLGH